MDNYINTYKMVYECMREIGTILTSIGLSEKKERAQLYGVMSLNLSKQNTKAILVLLENGLYPSTLVILRNVFETFFNYQWVLRAGDLEKQDERAIKLEGKAFRDIEKELNAMKENSLSSNPIWTSQMYSEKEKYIEFIKNNYPELTKNNNGRISFCEPEEKSFEQRLNKIERLKFYGLYRFTSAFVHPTPIIKDIILKNEELDKSPLEILKPHLQDCLDYCLFFIYGISHNLMVQLKNKDIDHKKYQIILTNMFSIIASSNAGKLLPEK